MFSKLNKEVFYAHPPEKVWLCITNSRALAAWLMENDFIAKWRASYGYVENIGYAIALAVINKKAAGRIYHVAEPETLSEGERVTKIGQIAGWKGKVVSLPKEKFPQDWNLPLNSEQDWFLDSTRIREELGYKEIVPTEQALKRTIEWERNHLSTEMQHLAAPF